MFDENIQVYLKSNVKAVGAIAVIAEYDSEIDIDVRIRLIDVVIDSEENILDFIDSFSIAERDNFTVNSSLRKLVRINDEILMNITKLQLQGYKLGKVEKTLKLENQNIKSMLFNVSE